MIQKSLLGQHCVLQSIWSMLFPRQAVPPQDSSWSFVRPLCLVPPSQVFVQELHGCQLSHSQSAKNLNVTKRFFVKYFWISLYLDNNCCCKIFVHYLILGRKVPRYSKDVWLNDVYLEYHPLNLLRKYFHSCSMWTIGPIHSLLKYFFRSRIYDWKVISICSSFVRVVKGTRR